MKKLFLTLVLALLSLFGAAAQHIHISENVPSEAAKVLEARLGAMLKSGGVADVTLQADAVVADRMETSGSISQTALSIELTLSGGNVTASFPLKGVGADEADAWTRACKQFLPRSQAAMDFVARLKQER